MNPEELRLQYEVIRHLKGVMKAVWRLCVLRGPMDPELRSSLQGIDRSLAGWHKWYEQKSREGPSIELK